MEAKSGVNNRAVIDFIEKLELPQYDREGLEGPEAAQIMPDFKLPGELVATIGSQIAGFAASVGPDIRPHIANAFLLAQLAANKKITDGHGNSKIWYDVYLNVLTNIGWVMEGGGASWQEIKTKDLNVHKEILAVVKAALGPAVAAAAMITTVLDGLANMSKDSPWITLFNRESQRAKANQFQISNTTGTTNNPSIKLLGFELDASKSVTQVLFFKFTSSSAKLRKFEKTLSINAEVFMQVAPSIKAKLADHIKGKIAMIEI